MILATVFDEIESMSLWLEDCLATGVANWDNDADVFDGFADGAIEAWHVSEDYAWMREARTLDALVTALAYVLRARYQRGLRMLCADGQTIPVEVTGYVTLEFARAVVRSQITRRALYQRARNA